MHAGVPRDPTPWHTRVEEGEGTLVGTPTQTTPADLSNAADTASYNLTPAHTNRSLARRAKMSPASMSATTPTMVVAIVPLPPVFGSS